MNINKTLNTTFKTISRTIKPQKVSLKKAASIAAEDLNHKSFELQDTLNYLLKNSKLSEEESKVVVFLLRDGKSTKEIASDMGVTQQSIRNYLRNAAEKMNKKYSEVSSSDYIHGRANYAQEVVNAIDKKEALDRVIQDEGNYFYEYPYTIFKRSKK